ncbi:uncharacterized protein STEHIDRAFT_89359 [Stereum hirsutum FP-91666 SS1]|uniref:uncharacterized protein n=1 Tax=Stereum hirsutum (strain FP-91666) TaxID=721885 RepID=UPI000440AFEB|nr:uncharacterized protein STEHIDRAFT_89359 [Stereum hirsutum FP-91666 SS1]EIM92394.1 hypothetical protein STEHIDRAFT_89359 [Stereum hirsutum FP-91666 SS1]
MPNSTISAENPLKGGCFCGQASYTITAPPKMRAYCHCTGCQRLNACPYNWTIHNDASNFTFTHPQPHAERLDSFVNPDKPWKTRFRCKTCGCTVASKNSKTNNVSVWGPHLERDNEGMIKRSDEVKPTAHIFYGTRIADVNDGLPKWEGYEGTSNRMG